MEQSTKIWVAVVVLAGLGGAVYYKSQEDKKIGTSQTTSAELPELKTPDDVDKIAIKNGDKPEIVLEKKGDKWEVTAPVTAPANQANIKSLVENLKDLKAKEVVAPAPTDDSKKDYEFTPEKKVHVVAFKGGEKKTDLTFGKSGARGQLAMIEGKPSIYAVSGYSGYLFTREVKGFRDTEILKFDDQNANQVTIEKKDGTLSFTKEGDKWAGTFKGKAIERFDEDKVKSAVGSFKGLTAEDFGDGKTPADTGLDAPDATVTIQLKDNAGKYTLKIGKTSTGTSRYVLKDGNATIFVVPQFVADWATTEGATKFQKNLDGGTDGGKKDLHMDMPPGMGLPPGMQMPPGMGDPHGGMGGDPHGH